MPAQKVFNQIIIKQNGQDVPYTIGDIIEGYYDSVTGKFYEESTYTTEIEGSSGFLYVDLAGDNTYIYKSNAFVKVKGEADNIIDSVTDGSMSPVTSNAVYDKFATLGTASEKNFTDLVRPGSHDLVESGSVYSAINNAMSSVYTPRGSIACADLLPALLVDANIGSIYETSDSGTTTTYFMQGAGKTINKGDSVGIIKAGQNTILFNLMGNTLDLTSYQTKALSSTIAGQSTVEGVLGALSSGKQDKLTNPLTKADVVNNLTTTTTNVPLSAAQGKAVNDKLTNFMSSDTNYVGVRNTNNAVTGGIGSDGNAFMLGGNPTDTKHINMYYNGSNLYCEGKWNGTSKQYKITDPIRSYSPTLSSKVSWTAGTPVRTDKEFFFGFVIQVKNGQTIAANETLFTLPEASGVWCALANRLSSGSTQIVVNQANVYTESVLSAGTYITILGSCPILK